jgi:hypothetical protein
MRVNLVIFRCPVNPRVISQFKYDEKAAVADATLYSMFRFPESSEVHFQCDIAVCKGKCSLPRRVPSAFPVQKLTKSHA